MRNRDIVVVGASAGGLEALGRLLAPIPADLPASLFIVQHLAQAESSLVELLRARTALAVGWAEQGDRIVRGRVYVAPPSVHLGFVDDHVQLTDGPAERLSRPSIDRLFRSAAEHHGPRVIGVLLTGMLDDGVAGLVAIHAAGGRTLVQDPRDAKFPELPEAALAALVPDALLPVDELGAAVIRMTAERAPPPRGSVSA